MSFYISLALERKTKQINQKNKTKNKKTHRDSKKEKKKKECCFILLQLIIYLFYDERGEALYKTIIGKSPNRFTSGFILSQSLLWQRKKKNYVSARSMETKRGWVDTNKQTS